MPTQGPDPLAAQPQAPILTVTLNPALDVATAADRVEPEIKLRCDAPVVDPGGGGINVSRAIARMSGRSTALVALSGPTGDALAALLDAEGITARRIAAPGETRQSLAVTDRSLNRQFRFVLPGPTWSDADVAAALDAVADAAPADGIVVLSGSNPPGVPPAFAALLASRLAGGARLFVDTSGAALRAVAEGEGCPDVLRMDEEEAVGLAGRPLPTRADTARFAAELVKRGAARSVLIARGGDGNIVAGPDGSWHVTAARVKIESKVGAGDSFVAGYALGLARGWPVDLALALAAAAASATCMTPATELCRPDDVARLFAAREVTPI